MRINIRNITGFILAMMAMILLSLQAFAAESTYSITINNKATGHIYETYQIFAGDLLVKENGDKVLSNIRWGTGVTNGESLGNPSEKIKVLLGDDKSVADEKNTVPVAQVDSFLDKIEWTSNPSELSYSEENQNYSMNGLPAGYYLIKDQVGSLNGKHDAYSSYILKVVGDITSDPKSDVPSATKKVMDTNDFTGEQSGWQDTADYDIGDAVPFQLTGVIPSNYEDYKEYKFIFHDSLSKGLTFDANSVKAYVVNGTGEEMEETLVDQDFYRIVENAASEDETFSVTFSDLKSLGNKVKPGSRIVVRYEATLNTNAVVGEAGNSNTMTLEYSNNPNSNYSANTGKTPADTVIVFTYKVIVNKVEMIETETGEEPSKQALKGAEFKLEKVSKSDDEKEETTVIDRLSISEESTFTFEGLDDGEYILTETKTPAGYNSIEPIRFTIVGEHVESLDQMVEHNGLSSLSVSKSSRDIAFTPSLADGSLTVDVVNVPGTRLPETGGMGTRLFYSFGTACLCGSVILFFRKKKTAKH